MWCLSRAHLGHVKNYFHVLPIVNLDTRRESWELAVAEITNFPPIFMVPSFIRVLILPDIWAPRMKSTSLHLCCSQVWPCQDVQATGMWEVRCSISPCFPPPPPHWIEGTWLSHQSGPQGLQVHQLKQVKQQDRKNPRPGTASKRRNLGTRTCPRKDTKGYKIQIRRRRTF